MKPEASMMIEQMYIVVPQMVSLQVLVICSTVKGEVEPIISALLEAIVGLESIPVVWEAANALCKATRSTIQPREKPIAMSEEFMPVLLCPESIALLQASMPPVQQSSVVLSSEFNCNNNSAIKHRKI